MMKAIETCECKVVHPEAVGRARKREIPVTLLLSMAEHFRVFADPTRLRILGALGDELCVCDLSAALGMTQSAVSHQLGLLRRARLVSARREGKTVFYSLADAHVASTIAMAREHLAEGAGHGR